MIIKTGDAEIVNVLNKEDEDDKAVSKKWQAVQKEAVKEEDEKSKKVEN